MNDIDLLLGNLNEVEVYQHSNSHLFNDIKRILRQYKKTQGDPNKEHPKSFYKNILKEINKKQTQKGQAKSGSDSQRLNILNSVFGTEQKMSLSDFEKKLYDYAENYPLGQEVGIKPETKDQTTQRLIPNEEINKTLNSPIISGFIKQMMEDFKGDENFDEAFRSIDNKLKGHFENSTSFVRYTKLGRGWLHFDAFQTDFFNKLRKMKYDLGKDGNKTIIDIINYMLKKEKEIFKSVVSYVLMKNKDAKQFTANTAELIQSVENVSGKGKLRELYEKLPKELGFEKISLEEVFKKMRTRPGKETEDIINTLSKAIKNKTEERRILKGFVEDFIETIVLKLQKQEGLSKSGIDSLIKGIIKGHNPNNFDDYHSLFHLFLDDIFNAYENKEIKKYFQENIDKIQAEAKKRNSTSLDDENLKIWWSTRGLLLENNELTISDDFRMILLEELFNKL